MKSTSGAMYKTPTISGVHTYIQSKLGTLHKPTELSRRLADVIKDQNSVEFMKHAANRLSGGVVTATSEKEYNDVNMLNGLKPRSLVGTKSKGYLDFAAYVLLRQNDEKSNGRQGNSKDFIKQLNKELDTIQEEIEKKDASGMAGKEEDSNTWEEIQRIYEEKLNNLTWLIGRVMSDFIPEIGTDTTHLMENVDGEERFYRQILDTSELHRINPADIGLPDEVFYDKVVNNEFTIPVRASGLQQKQFVYILADASSSMTENCNIRPFTKFSRFQVAREIIAHFVERVKSGNCELCYRAFATEPKKLVEANDEQSAETMQQYVTATYGSMGGTHIRSALEVAFRDLDQLDFSGRHKPEILIITDGEDNSVYGLELPSDVKLNYINVEQEKNTYLYDLCTNFISL